MRNLILILISIIGLLSACEKIERKDPTADPIRVTTPTDTTKSKLADTKRLTTKFLTMPDSSQVVLSIFK